MSYTLSHLKKYVGGESIDEKETVIFSFSDNEFMWMLRLPRDMTQEEVMFRLLRDISNCFSRESFPPDPKKYSLDYLQKTSISATFRDGKHHLVILNSNAHDFMWFMRFPIDMTQSEIITELTRTVGNLFKRHPKNSINLETALKELKLKLIQRGKIPPQYSK